MGMAMLDQPLIDVVTGHLGKPQRNELAQLLSGDQWRPGEFERVRELLRDARRASQPGASRV